jgi:hypothetical protein
MVRPLDVFEKNGPIWLGAERIAKAIDLVLNAGPGSYFVFSHQTQQKSFFDVSSDGAVSPISDPECQLNCLCECP